MWQRPWHSARLLGGGLYLLLCATRLGQGSFWLQPSTALLLLAFLVLLLNTGRALLLALRSRTASTPPSPAPRPASPLLGPGLAGQGRAEGGQQPTPPSPVMQRAMDQELIIYQRTHAALSSAAAAAVPLLAAAVALAYRALSGRRLAVSVVVAGVLWLGMLVGEQQLLSQPAAAALAYSACFTLPVAYARARHVIDTVVEDLLRFITRVMISGDRSSLLLAGVTAGGLLLLAPLALITRTSLALSAGFAVLLWGVFKQQQQQQQQLQQQQGRDVAAPVGAEQGTIEMRDKGLHG
ncbi:hypothetical protein V8C86DRAFT_2911463 [Haematococcus lacustris]